MSTQHHILFVEDDTHIGRLVTSELRDVGYTVDWTMDGAAGFERFDKGTFDLTILDIMLPSLDGLEICRRIRAQNRSTPILMLTARAEIQDVVRGLEMGADDYLTKPFSTAVLMARIQALLRRVQAAGAAAVGQDAAEEDILYRGALVIDPYRHKITVAGESVTLSAKEFDLLSLFARNPGRVYNRSELLDQIWGPDFEGYDHTVNTHINRLRAKIESDPTRPRCIQTVWGVGYRFAELTELVE